MTAGGIFKPGIPPVRLFCQAARQSLKLHPVEGLLPFLGSGHLGGGGGSSVSGNVFKRVRRQEGLP